MHGKGCVRCFIIGNIGGIIVGSRGCAERNDAACQTLCDLLPVFDVAVDKQSAVRRQKLCKFAERSTDICQVFKEVQMVFFDIQDDADFREKV